MISWMQNLACLDTSSALCAGTNANCDMVSSQQDRQDERFWVAEVLRVCQTQGP